MRYWTKIEISSSVWNMTCIEFKNIYNTVISISYIFILTYTYYLPLDVLDHLHSSLIQSLCIQDKQDLVYQLSFQLRTRKVTMFIITSKPKYLAITKINNVLYTLALTLATGAPLHQELLVQPLV